MKLRNSALLCALLLLLGATMAFAAVATEPTVATADSVSATTLSAQPPASELTDSDDCAAPSSPFATSVLVSTGTTNFGPACGKCSETICKNQVVDSICGSAGGGQFKRCVDWSGNTCAADGGVRCRCTADPIP